MRADALTPAHSPAFAAAPATAPARRGRLAGRLRWAGWILSGLLAVAFLAQPVSVEAQLALCAAALGGMVAVWLVFPRRGLARMAFLALGSLVVLRYLYWRFSETLPAPDDAVGFGLGLLLLGAEMYCVMILCVSLVINADPLERADAPVVGDADLPSIDIFIPTYNEDSEILAVTVAAARQLDYPEGKATVWLLDDGGTDQKCADADPAKAAAARARRAELQALCADLGARYLTRARNEHAKAGNLNNGLTSARGDLVLVLDADHAPFRSFLKETVGHFAADKRLFLVQTPHVFLNPDPIERNLRTFATMPSENEMFYSVTQAGLDKWNGSFFCGSAALLRRAALDEVGGFSGVTITEDCETAFELHARGWTSVYVDKPLIAGLQPETFAAFIGQRARWCQGMFQIMLLKNPLLKPGLEPIQRLAYLSSMTFWFFPLPRLAFMFAPLLHIFFDVKIFVSSLDEALAFTAMYVVANMMLQNYLYGRVRWPWVSELYEYVQGVFLARSIVSVMLSPRRPSFNVTAKGLTLDNDHLSALAKPFFAIFLALAAGCATAAWRYLYEPGVTDLMLVVGLWCLFNLVIAGVALGVVAERRQLERAPSLGIERTGDVTAGGERFPVAVTRVSSAGCTVRRCDGRPWPAAASTGTLVGCGLDGRPLDALGFTVLAPADEGRSLTFADLAPRDYRAVADLMYGDAAPLRSFLAGRRRPMDLLTGSARFLAWGVTEPLRAFAYTVAARGSSEGAAKGEAKLVGKTVAQKCAEPIVTVPATTGEAQAFLAAPAVMPAGATAKGEASPTATSWKAPAVVEAAPVARAPAEIANLTAMPAVLMAAEPAVPEANPAPAEIVAQAAAGMASSQPEAVTALTPDAWLEAFAALCRAERQAIEGERQVAPVSLDPDHWMASVLGLAAAESEPAKSEAPEVHVPRPTLPTADRPRAATAARRAA